MVFNFKDKNNQLIFDMDGPEKKIFFEILLGVIFGFNNSEKEQFRGDPSLNKTYTAVLTMALDLRTMIIERDFETDFTACLISDPKSIHSVFQGKDCVENSSSRPFLQVLKSIFPIIDKELFEEICYQSVNQENSNFSEVLNILYFLLTPEFKFSKIPSLKNKCKTIERDNNLENINGSQINKYYSLYRAVEHLLKISNYEKQISDDKDKLELLVKRLQTRIGLSKATEKALSAKFSALSSFSPVQLKADIQIWKSLNSIVEINEKKLRDLKMRKVEINNILKSEFAIYPNLPKTFKEDVRYFKEKQLEINYLTELHKDAEYMFKKEKERQTQFLRYFIEISAGISTAFVSAVFFIQRSAWTMSLLLMMLLILISTVPYRMMQKKKKVILDEYRSETDELKDKIENIKAECDKMSKISKAMDVQHDIDIHIQNYTKYEDCQAELEDVQNEIYQIKDLIYSDEYQVRISEFKKKYRDSININQKDLDELLDEYIKISETSNKYRQNLNSSPALETLHQLIALHSKKIKEIKSVRLQFTKSQSIEINSEPLSEVLDKIDRKIKNLELV